jgi:predicted DNA-binding protein (UPF0251 family)
VTDLRHIAEHEAAHTVMRYVYGRQTPGCISRFRNVTIIPEGGAAGHLQGIEATWMETEALEDLRYTTIEQQDAATRRRIEHEIMVTLAGAVWDEMHGRFDPNDTISVNGHDIYNGAAEWDLRSAHGMASLTRQSNDTTSAYLDWLGARTLDFLSSPLVSEQVVAIADALMDAETLSYSGVRRVIAAHNEALVARFDDAREAR